MRKPLTSILTFIILIISVSDSYSQDKKPLKLHFEGGCQFGNDQTGFIGVGTKLRKNISFKLIDYYDIHASLYFEKYFKPDNLKNNYSLSSQVDYEFKYFLIGLIFKNYNMRKEDNHRIDISPEIGIGYKYFWLTYSRNLLIYQEQIIPISKNNLRLMIHIPLFNIKI